MSLNFSCMDISDASVRAVAERLPGGLTSLSLNFFGWSMVPRPITDASVRAVADRLPGGLTSLSLNFTGCSIEDPLTVMSLIPRRFRDGFKC